MQYTYCAPRVEHAMFSAADMVVEERAQSDVPAGLPSASTCAKQLDLRLCRIG